MIVLRLEQHLGEDLFYVITLQGTAAPKCSPQLSTRLLDHRQESDCAALMSGPRGGMVILKYLRSKDIHDGRLVSHFFHLAEGPACGEVTEREIIHTLPDPGRLGSLCLVSGVALSRTTYHGAKPYTQVVSVYCFDFK
ncbi:hypothetical protein DL93DRAFT_2090749 [Clavulina sp. PMI_390]|nr:hypothetical protein DL93DRAFT_2090749 [Clavulina sp. PMI_390]